jgi:hypothetical protein|tara:strand:- start:128 stop:409 length:282 start_codon:yes stop_codon:yes gene_type:complete
MSQSKLDMDQDGKVTQQELEYIKAENEDKRQDQQRRMASVAMWSMIVVTCVLLSPIIPIERIESLVGIMTTFYLSQAAVVSAFFGATAYLNRE